ncbi:carboxymuconolactone decarboxylase family protein [Rhizobium sp. ICMP 5592]|uniref:carboxymuconolactone decarboxylase family protein n=1 Tax=Rhizobium sp. ICMP 5592 TaxID=2292445 RepID=UPI001296F08E|nr:carboxymuconolactone decarboxylase family protein [Rhizobium sp. ICMP 5592]MQB40875.1 carboxymuconolactone decarboxylase family protein [Rhizobium sp. ICMP 5592]
MKHLIATAVIIGLPALALAQSEQSTNRFDMPTTSIEGMKAVSPALEHYAEDRLAADLWKRTDLNPRDRSLVTVAALIATGQSGELPQYIDLALRNGVKPAEISETITHLAFYTGWPNAMSALKVAKDLFQSHGIGTDQLPPAQDATLPLNEEAEARRVAMVDQALGPDFKDLAGYTTDVLFKDLWLRPALAPRDRSLVTISALVATGRVAQLTGHTNIGMNNGLTKQEISGVITHLAFYSGWPNAMSAAPVVRKVFEERGS